MKKMSTLLLLLAHWSFLFSAGGSRNCHAATTPTGVATIDINNGKTAQIPWGTTGFVLTSTGTSTPATWQAAGSSNTAGALATTGAAVNVSSAAPPSTGQVLTSTDATHSTWQTPAAFTGVTADAPLSGLGTTGSHLVLSTAGTWSGNASTVTNGVYTTGAGTVFLAPNGSAAALTSFPTLNQDTTGTAAKTNALNSATTVVNVSSATAPTAGQVLTATDDSDAAWATPAAPDLSGQLHLDQTTPQTVSNGAPIFSSGVQTPFVQQRGGTGFAIYNWDTDNDNIYIGADDTMTIYSPTNPVYFNGASSIAVNTVTPFTGTTLNLGAALSVDSSSGAFNSPNGCTWTIGDTVQMQSGDGSYIAFYPVQDNTFIQFYDADWGSAGQLKIDGGNGHVELDALTGTTQIDLLAATVKTTNTTNCYVEDNAAYDNTWTEYYDDDWGTKVRFGVNGATGNAAITWQQGNANIEITPNNGAVIIGAPNRLDVNAINDASDVASIDVSNGLLKSSLNGNTTFDYRVGVFYDYTTGNTVFNTGTGLFYNPADSSTCLNLFGRALYDSSSANVASWDSTGLTVAAGKTLSVDTIQSATGPDAQPVAFTARGISTVAIYSHGQCGFYDLDNSSKTNFACGGVSGAVNYLAVNNSITGDPVVLVAAGDGTDTDISMQLQPAGAGTVNISTLTAGGIVAADATTGALTVAPTYFTFGAAGGTALPDYLNNAAAVGAGLPVNAVYRITATDALAIVH